MNEFQLELDCVKYRIFRTDSKNLAIQRRNGSTWKTMSYHGNSVPSLASGLTELIVGPHLPDTNDDLVEQIGWLRDAIEFYGDRILTALEVAGPG